MGKSFNKILGIDIFKRDLALQVQPMQMMHFGNTERAAPIVKNSQIFCHL
jgi:hypothetical protein